jgi:nucleoside-diphosphate-sugar epimerase
MKSDMRQEWVRTAKISKATIYLITGANGNLARHIIYQLIDDYADDISLLRIIALFHKSFNYLDFVLDKKLLYSKSKKIDSEQLAEIILPIKFELTDDNCGLSEKDISLLKETEIDYFIHNAASSDFRKTEYAAQKMSLINVQGTTNVLNLCSKISIKYFAYTSSAYVCGKKYGFVNVCGNDYADFNNYYEESKFIADRLIDKFCSANHIDYCNFRISSISGRLINEPIGYTVKCDLFLAWAMFFYKIIEKKRLRQFQEFFLSLRIFVNDCGLNIVPVDYTAKLLIDVIQNKSCELHCVHITNPVNISHKEYLSAVLDRLNVTGYSFVEEMPDTNTYSDIEKSYYKIMGPLFNDYIANGSWDFDFSNIQQKYGHIIDNCRPKSVEDFKKLLDYPIAMQFKL